MCGLCKKSTYLVRVITDIKSNLAVNALLSTGYLIYNLQLSAAPTMDLLLDIHQCIYKVGCHHPIV